MDTGWLAASSARGVSPGTDWISHDNAKTQDDQDAIVTLVSDTMSYQLNLYNFNANISVGNIITGIWIGLERAAQYSNIMKDEEIYLKNGLVNKGNNKADTGTFWPASDAIVTYGGDTDLWGTSWTVKIVYEAAPTGSHLMIMGM
jgi:hypothetical protein